MQPMRPIFIHQEFLVHIQHLIHIENVPKFTKMYNFKNRNLPPLVYSTNYLFIKNKMHAAFLASQGTAGRTCTLLRDAHAWICPTDASRSSSGTVRRMPRQTPVTPVI